LLIYINKGFFMPVEIESEIWWFFLENNNECSYKERSR